MPTAIPYARYSSSNQHKGSSLERQEEMIGGWLQAHPEYDLTPLSFRDLAKSGWKGEHIKEGGGFGKLLVAIENKVFKKGDVLLIEAIDRAGRLPVLEMLTKIISPILEAGVSIVTLEDGVEFTKQSLNEGGHIYILVGKIQAARSYSENLSRRLTGSYDSRRKLAAEGKTPKRITPAWLTSEGVVIPEVATQVKLAFELYVSGLGKAVIAKRMRESGVAKLAKTSGPGVEGWLRNEAAIGKWSGSHVYEPIIELSLFQRAQIEAAKRKTAPRNKTATHFLVGLVKCGSCGGNFIMRTIGGVQVSMRCRKRQELKGCENKRVIPKEVIDAVYRYTSVKAAREAVAREHTGVNEAAIIAAEAELIVLNRQMEELVASVKIVGGIPELLSQIKVVEADRTRTSHGIALLKATIVPQAANTWKQQGEVWALERGDPQRLSAMLRSVGYSMTVHVDKTISASDSDGVYRFASVDRKTGKYRLYAKDKLILIPKNSGWDNDYYEPFDFDEMASSQWLEEDYDDLQRLYK